MGKTPQRPAWRRDLPPQLRGIAAAAPFRAGHPDGVQSAGSRPASARWRARCISLRARLLRAMPRALARPALESLSGEHAADAPRLGNAGSIDLHWDAGHDGYARHAAASRPRIAVTAASSATEIGAAAQGNTEGNFGIRRQQLCQPACEPFGTEGSALHRGAPGRPVSRPIRRTRRRTRSSSDAVRAVLPAAASRAGSGAAGSRTSDVRP